MSGTGRRSGLRWLVGSLVSVVGLASACWYADPRARPTDAGLEPDAVAHDATARCDAGECAAPDAPAPCQGAAAAGWERLAPAGEPVTPRSNARMAFDPTDDSLLLFGGRVFADGGPETALDDTWRLTDRAWTRLTPPAKPSPRYDHAMTTRPRAGQPGAVYVFGGQGPSPTGALNAELWEWNGSTWLERCTSAPCSANKPTPRTTAGLAYDVDRDRLVLVGGREASGPANDTWEWNGATWSLVCGKSLPSCGFLASEALSGGAVYDTARRRTIFLHEQTPSLTYEYDGSRWVLADTAISPPFPGGTYGHVVGNVYDPVRGVMVSLGHSSEEEFRAWEWNGRCWYDAWPRGPIPNGYLDQAVTYDPKHERVVRMGGSSGRPPSVERDVYVRPSR